jgi:tetratricopeptide (TPR) repeat protein
MRLPILVSVVSAWLPAGLLFPADDPKLTAEARADIEIHFLAAKRAETAGDLTGAADEYENILKKYPKAVPEIYQNLGLVYYLAHDYDAAIQKFSQGLQLKPTMVGAHLVLGSCYLNTEQPEEALGHLQYAHKEQPTPESATYLGLAHSALRQYDLAARYFRSALDEADQKDSILYFIGDSYLKLSERIGNTLAEQSSDSKYDYLMTAKILDSQSWYQIAAKAYLDAAKKDPWNASIFFPLARMLAILELNVPSQLALNRYRQLMPVERRVALDPDKLPKVQTAEVGLKIDYEGVLRALPPVGEKDLPPLPLVNGDVNQVLRKTLTSDQTGRWRIAVEHLMLGRWQEGIAALEKVPAPATAWIRDYLIATAHLWSEAWDKAEEVLNRPRFASQSVPAVQMLRWEVYQQLAYFYFNRLLDEYPQSTRAHFLKARTLDVQGKKEALEEYQAAIAADPQQIEPRIALADYYLSNSKYQEALSECERALEINPYSSPTKMHIGRIYIQLRQPEKGISYLQSALRSDPDDAQARADLGRGWELLNQTDKAIAEYKRALELDPGLNRLHYVLGRIYRKLGQTELADREYQIFQKTEASDRKKHIERIRQFRESQGQDQNR